VFVRHDAQLSIEGELSQGYTENSTTVIERAGLTARFCACDGQSDGVRQKAEYCRQMAQSARHEEGYALSRRRSWSVSVAYSLSARSRRAVVQFCTSRQNQRQLGAAQTHGHARRSNTGCPDSRTALLYGCIGRNPACKNPCAVRAGAVPSRGLSVTASDRTTSKHFRPSERTERGRQGCRVILPHRPTVLRDSNVTSTVRCRYPPKLESAPTTIVKKCRPQFSSRPVPSGSAP
jgi:hypothetical protein